MAWRRPLLVALALAIGITGTAAMLWIFGDRLFTSRRNFHLWAWAQFLRHDNPWEIYDRDLLFRFLWTLPELAESITRAPCPYPPFTLLFFLVLAPFSYDSARLLWTLTSLAACLVVTGACAGGPWRQRALAALAVLALPAVTVNAAFGQTGFLSDALLGAGLLLLGSYPALAGVAFGLLAFKPQLGLLVPVVLLASRAWRTIAVALLTVTGMALAATAVLGWEMWPAWIASLTRQTGALERPLGTAGGLPIDLMPTLFTALLRRGAPAWLAWAGQGTLTLVIGAVIWRLYRLGNRVEATLAVLLGAALVTPYAFIYDLPAASAAAVALLVRRMATHKAPPWLEAALLAWFHAALAATYLRHVSVAYVMLANLALFALAAWRAWERPPDHNS